MDQNVLGIIIKIIKVLIQFVNKRDGEQGSNLENSLVIIVN